MVPDRTILHLVNKKNPRPPPPLKNYGVHTIKPQLRPWLFNIYMCIIIYLGTDHLTSRGGGWLCFFSKKNILIPNVDEKNILILVEEKKNNMIQSFCHIT